MYVNDRMSIKKIILILSALALSVFIMSCGARTPNDGESSDTETESAASRESSFTDTAPDESDILAPVSTVPDGAIAISSAAELAMIGVDKDHPYDGYYVLTADIDLTGESSWTPIGRAPNASGVTRGNVFSGTLDGMGHIITGLTISKENYETSHYGLFGSIGSSSEKNPCEIKNLIFRDVDISLISSAQICTGTLAGQASGYVSINNIALLSGSVRVILNGGEALGTGGLIGQCRTQTDSGLSNNGISIKNIFCNLDISVENNMITNWCSGIIGRVRASDLAELYGIVFVGSTKYNGGSGYAVTSGDSGAAVSGSIYYLYESGMAYNSLGIAVTDAEFVSGSIELGDEWTCEEGLYPIPEIAVEGSAFNMLDMVGISFAAGENAQSVKTSFTLPTELVGERITWESSNTDHLIIDGGIATVKQPESGYATVTLTASYKSFERKYELIIKSSAVYGFTSQTASPGDTLTLSGYGKDANPTWTLTDMKTGDVSVLTGINSYKIPEDGSELHIRVTAKGYDDRSVYCSILPVVYITSDTEYYDVVKAVYSSARMTMQGVTGAADADELYSGDIKIKLRGNSTALREKRPFKIKLDTACNLLGISSGAARHWVLLANDVDHTLLRNKLLMDLSGAMGADAYMRSTNVTLIYNGEYYGVYQLCEHVRIDETNIDIFDWNAYADSAAEAIAEMLVSSGKIKNSEYKSVLSALKDTLELDYSWIDSGSVTYEGETYVFSDYGIEALPDASGGFLLEMDFYSKGSTMLATLPTAYKQPLYFNSPKAEDPTAARSLMSTSLYAYASKYMQTFEYALHSDDFYYRDSDTHYAAVSDFHGTGYTAVEYSDAERDGSHYSSLFDMDSLIENFIFCEIAMNWDSMKNSFFIYKEVGEPAVIGPQWDFDWAWGNKNMYGINTYYPESWHTTEDAFTVEQYYQTVQWNRMLIRDPYFLTKVYEAWQQLRPTVIEELICDGGIIESSLLGLRAAAAANDYRWSYSYIAYGGELFDDAAASMKSFIETRISWLDRQFSSIESFTESLGYYVKSKKLDIVSIDAGDANTVFTVSVSDAAVSAITFQINGEIFGDAAVIDGKATLTVSNDKLQSHALNCVEAKAKGADGKYIVNTACSKPGNYNLIESDFEAFDFE